MTGKHIDGGPTLFIGTGAMGEPMATCLAKAGFDLYLRDADTERAETLASTTNSRVLKDTDLATVLPAVTTVILMLPSSAVVEAVLEGPRGILSGLSEGSVVIDMSSSTPESTRRLASVAAAVGVNLIDAPVSGGVPRARTGELTIMVGGGAAIVESRRELLLTMGSVVTHVGAHGAGHALKALNNLLSAVGMAAASEVLTIAARFGIEPRTALDVINGATGRNQSTEVKFGQYILSRAFDSGFAMSLMVKDLRTALDLAHGSGVAAPVSAAATEEWIAALSRRGAAADHTEIAAYVEDRAQVELTEPA